MNTHHILKNIIQNALKKLRTLQESDGGFADYASQHVDMSHPKMRHTTFATSLILISLQKTKELYPTDIDLLLITKHGIDFLCTEKHENGSWNYWKKNLNKSKHIPNDLDATFCALSAIRIHKPEIITGTILAQVVYLLIATETKEGGPYNTWIVNTEEYPTWKNIDPVVQANIAFFLALQDIKTENINTLLQEIILESEKYSSLYYTDPFIGIYFITRTVCGGNHKNKSEYMERIKKYVLKAVQSKNHLDNTLKSAMSIVMLCYCNPTKNELIILKSLVDALIVSFSNEHYGPYPIYVQQSFGEQIEYSGSSAVTLGVIIEALSLYENLTTTYDKKQESTYHLHDHLEQDVIQTFLKRCKDIPEIIPQLEKLSQQIIKQDIGKQITLLPHLFYHSLICENEKSIHNAILTILGATNLAGWIAYRIYDDILDNEGKPELLPIANICIRQITETYLKLLPKEFHITCSHILNNLDHANLWERQRTYMCGDVIPDYGHYDVLAHKSLAHCLGPVTILALLGYSPTHLFVTETILFFHHYLIARQLHDDAHDWQSDLEKGFTNSVAATILTNWHKHNSYTFVLSDELPALQSIFWNEEILKTTKDIQTHIHKAKNCLSKISILKDKTYLESILEPLQKSIEKTLYDRNIMISFLETYKN
jgi:hypothetical protein